LLLHEIFFHTGRKLHIIATCPRCGKAHRIGSCINGSPRRFCRDCQNYSASTWCGEAVPVYETRGLKTPAPRDWSDEPGVGSTG
jgi:hypothetical protein